MLDRYTQRIKLYSLAEIRKWTDIITNDEVFQMAKDGRLPLKNLKNRRHSWTGHTIRHNDFVVNILEGAISGKKAVARPRLQY